LSWIKISVSVPVIRYESMIFSINIVNIGNNNHIGIIEPYIGRYYKINIVSCIVSCTSKSYTILLIYI